MKIAGKKVTPPSIEVVVIPRDNGNLVFRAQPVLDYSDFDKLCPEPKPPVVMKPGGKSIENVEDADYKKRIDEWATKKAHWMVIKSLGATEGLEFETVDVSDSDTWVNYQNEMTDSGLTHAEVAAIFEKVTSACGLNQNKIEEATKAFLAGQAAKPKE